MVDKKQLKREYKERIPAAGIFIVQNKHNGRFLLGSSRNLAGPLNRIEMELTTGAHRNKELLSDWQKYGQEKFQFEILEKVDQKDGNDFEKELELKELEQKWIDKLDPAGQLGYNLNTKIRI